MLGLHPDALVVRTSLLVGREQPGRHERAVLEAARGEREMTFFEDEWRAPIWSPTWRLLELARMDVTGLLHVAGADAVSRYELACMIATAHGLPADRLRRGRIAESGLERAANCVLDSGRACALLRAPPPGVR